MTTFDMRGQHVTNQYNFAGNISFSHIQSHIEFIDELEKLKAEILKAKDASYIESDIETDIQYEIQKAVDHARKADPNKQTTPLGGGIGITPRRG